jgi:hypothetical protein
MLNNKNDAKEPIGNSDAESDDLNAIEYARLIEKLKKLFIGESEFIYIYNENFAKNKEYINFLEKNLYNSFMKTDMSAVINEMVTYISEKQDMKKFYEKYQSPKVLLIEDFSLCAGKECTQETLYTFLKYRFDNNLSTILVSNSNDDKYIMHCLLNLINEFYRFSI